MKRLEGKVAIVTGAARGIGKAVSLGFAREGADIIAVDISDSSDTKSSAEALGVRAITITADVSDEAAVTRMIREAVDKFGHIDILANIVGIFPLQPIEQISFADWKKVLGINLDSVFLCSKAVVPHMRKQKYGRIINVSSTAYLMGVPNYVHYLATKGGVIGVTRSLAGEVGQDGITVNCIAPGLTDSEGVKEAEVAKLFDVLVPLQCIQRREVPEDLVGPALFFASDDSAFVTGQTLCVDGGWTRN